MSTLQLLAKERVASIREVQKNPSQALQGVTRVIRGAKTVGFFFSSEEMDDILEDFEAFSSPHFQAEVGRARKELAKGKGISLGKIVKRYGI